MTATTIPNLPDPGMELHDLLTDREFLDRSARSGQADERFEALRVLAGVFTEAPAVVLQKLVDAAVEFCGADSAGISLEEPDGKGSLRFRWIAISGSFAQYLHGTTPRFFSPCGTCLSSGRPQHYRVTKPYYDFLGVSAEPINDGLLIPWTSDESRGTIWAVSHGSRETFSPDDYKVLSALADFAGISVRLTEREQRNVLDMRALQRIQQVTTQLVGSHDLHSRLAEVLSAASDLTGTEKGSIQLYDRKGRVLRMMTHQGFGARFVEHFSNQDARLMCDLEVRKVERMTWENIAEEPSLKGTEDLEVIFGDGIRAIQSTPLISLDGRLLGLLNNHFRAPHRPSERELGYLDLLARMAADFIERWQADKLLQQSHNELESQVEQRTSSLRQLSARLMGVQDDERRRIARELHDSLGQYLVAVKMNLSQLKDSGANDAQVLADSEEILDQCLSETRTISHLLHPPLLDESGLSSAARWYVEGFSKRGGIEVHLHLDEKLGRLPQDSETALFRVLQESLNNVHRHSGSKKVDVSIRLDAGEIVATIRDYGCGFGGQQLHDVNAGRGRGVGLTGLRERIAALGGVLEVLPGEPGALIKVTLPVEKNSTGDARKDGRFA